MVEKDQRDLLTKICPNYRGLLTKNKFINSKKRLINNLDNFIITTQKY